MLKKRRKVLNLQSNLRGTARRCILWGALCLGLTAVVLAQTALSTLRGTVYDQTGGVVPGVEVIATEATTNVRARSVVTDEHGSYEMPDLRPGTYRLTAELPGFKTFRADGVILDSGQIRRLNVVLETGELTEHVTVEAGAAVITTESGTVSGAVTSTLIKDAALGDSLKPYPGPQMLLATLPGVAGRGWNITVAGQTTVSMQDDGVENQRTGNQAVQLYAWEEVRVVAVNAPADQARAASLNTTSKRGSNAFRGMAFYRHTNSAFGARDFFHPVRTHEIFHDIYAEAGGPILRDRTFFFAAWNNAEMPGQSFPITHVPTLKMREGDLSQFATPVMDPLTGEPFPDNRIPVERMNPTSLKIQELFYPLPNLGGPDQLTNNHGYIFPYPGDNFRTFYPLIRVDHELTERNSLFFRYTGFIGPYVLPRIHPSLGGWTRTRNHGKYVLANTHVFSPAVINTFRVGFNRNDIRDGFTVDGFTPPSGSELVAAIGLQGVNPRGLDAMGAPVINVTGLGTFSQIAGGINSQGTDWSLDQSLTWTSGRHVWKLGAQYHNLNDFRSVVETNTYGSFTFDNSLTGVAYGNFLLGLPRVSTRLDPLLDRWRRGQEVALYAMDTFKLTPSLTLDYGLRWDYFPGDRFDDGLMFNWNPQTGNVIVPEAALSQVSPLYPQSITIQTGEVIAKGRKTNFRPRFGVAYRMADNLVLRGGYGVYTERLSPFLLAQGTGPFQIAETFFNTIEDGQPFFSFPNPFPADLAAAATPSVSVVGYPSETRNGAIHQFNASLERQFGEVGIRLSYVGSRSRGLHYALQLNKPEPSLTPFTASRRPYPQFVGASFRQNDGKSNFDSLQLEGQRRVGWLTFNANYTWASNLHNYLNTQNPYDVTDHWSRDDFQPRHRTAITALIELPWGAGRRYLSQAPALVDQILGGWTLQTTSFFATGKHFSPAFSGSDPSNTNTVGGLPDRICDGNLPRGQRTLERWFDPSCFVVPPLEGRFGTSAPNVLVGPGIHVHHLALVKKFRVGERFLLTYNASFSNVFNRAHFTNPRNNISAANPGILTSTPGWTAESEGGARRGQMMLRLEW